MKTFHRDIIFTKIPLNGQFRYKDIFQIFPANFEGMPQTTFYIKHHPVVLEYWTSEDENIKIKTDFEELDNLYSSTATILSKQDLILSLLSLITNHLFFRYTDVFGSWGFPILFDNAGKEANNWASKWCLPQFHWPGRPEQLQINSFSNMILPTVELVSYSNYYFKNPNFDCYFDKEISFPEITEMVLDSYFGQSFESREILNAAISFAVSSMELNTNKKTLAIISSFTAIETMVNMEYKEIKNDKCQSCGQLKYGVSKKYRDFLFKYIGEETDSNKKKFNAYYSLRGKIIHTVQRLKTEKLFSNISKDEKDKELLKETEILMLGKLSIINWLFKNGILSFDMVSNDE